MLLMRKKPVIFTVGHSTHEIHEFIEILRAYGIKRLIDIRTIPRSRHNPQFSREELAKTLRSKRINYKHMKDLGGLRHTTANSVNQGWRNKSFRGYADYMATKEFAAALDKLIEISKEKPIAIMCAESVPWRCHRSLVADALTNKGILVKHIMSKTSSKEHTFSPMAIMQNGHIIYPKEI